jgi:hypothetical protein
VGPNPYDTFILVITITKEAGGQDEDRAAAIGAAVQEWRDAPDPSRDACEILSEEGSSDNLGVTPCCFDP